MCSDSTISPTEEFIKDKDLDKNLQIEYIIQRNEICLDLQEKCELYRDKDGLKTPADAPNGNGGIFDALTRGNMYSKFLDKGIEILNIISVDNVANQFLDLNVLSKFWVSLRSIGIHKELSYDIISKSVKAIDKEKGGRFVRIGDKLLIKKNINQSKIDFSGPTDQLNICHHYFSVDFLIKHEGRLRRLPNHRTAPKKIPFLKKWRFRIPG